MNMINTPRALVLMAPVLFITACGGGGTSSDAGGAGGGPAMTVFGGGGGAPAAGFAAQDAAADSLIETYVTQAGLPVAGLARSTDVAVPATAQYNGAITASLNGVGVVADLTLDADFGSGDITGTGANFVLASTGAIDGTISGTGSIDGAAVPQLPQMTIVLRGDLANAGNTLATAISLDGDFYANGGDTKGAVAGIAEGQIGSDVVTDGVFAADK